VKAINEPEAPQEGEVQDISVTLSASTNTGANSSSSYSFQGGYTISNTKSKSYATGNDNGIKYSAGVQYTINLPEDVGVEKVIFSGYDNYTDTDAYLGELAGMTFPATDYVFPKTKESVVHTVELPKATYGNITFTPQGKQVVLSITLVGKKGSVTSVIDNVGKKEQPASTHYYNMQGQRVTPGFRGIVIRDGRKTLSK
jgi:hypothetical protein